MISVVHETAQGGDKTYANIDSVMPLPKGMQEPEQANDDVYVSLTPSLFDQEAYDGLTDYLKEKINKSEEWLRMFGQVPDDHPDPAEVMGKEAEIAADEAELDDEIPF